MLKLGIALGTLNPAYHLPVAREAERLGFESVWMPEHLVFPLAMSGSPHPRAQHPPVPPTTPVFDAFAWLSFLAGKTERIRLGTSVYLLGLRHPFAAARAIQTLDVVSRGRAEIGIGAGWLREEWTAAGLDPSTRGRRLDEGLAVCKRLWVEPVIEHHGEFFDFGPVAFEPKTVQKPWPPIHVGGESPSALRRAARHGDGWLGLFHTPESIKAPLARIRELRMEFGRSEKSFAVTTGGRISSCDDVRDWEEAGVDRVIVTAWVRSRDAVESLRRLAEIAFDGGGATPR
ncbi:MAG TPA: TIGR03619 family F420-dependent LLM class oxidoreductase [Myxococcota bacterium]|nr:TIGR03619 family F420-dependent LLM class oxidoreductase [Myxococcota bacterium]